MRPRGAAARPRPCARRRRLAAMVPRRPLAASYRIVLANDPNPAPRARPHTAPAASPASAAARLCAPYNSVWVKERRAAPAQTTPRPPPARPRPHAGGARRGAAIRNLHCRARRRRRRLIRRGSRGGAALCTGPGVLCINPGPRSPRRAAPCAAPSAFFTCSSRLSARGRAAGVPWPVCRPRLRPLEFNTGAPARASRPRVPGARAPLARLVRVSKRV